MKNLLKNKWALVGIISVIIVVLVGGYLFMQNSKKAKLPVVQESPEEQAITMKGEDIGLTLTPTNFNREVVMRISDVSLFNSFEYEMNYDAVVDGESVPRGAIGSGEIKPGDNSVERKITIGTCSSGTCKYDKGVVKVSFIIRLNLKTGKTGVVQQDLSLEE